MGRSFTNSHIFNASGLTKPQFKKTLTDMMKSKGYTKAAEDDAAVSYSLVFTKDRRWVTVLGEDINALDLAKSLGLQVLSVELVDSDFAELKLHSADGPADILMLGNPYMDEYPQPTPDKWQSILGESTWSQVEEIQSGDHTFAEDALAEFAQLIGLGENILLESDDIPDGAEVLHFKKAKEKKLTLNAAFKQVFGPELERRGYKQLKGVGSIYARIINGEILQFVTYIETKNAFENKKSFSIESCLATIYRANLDFKKNKVFLLNGFKSLCNLYSDIYGKYHVEEFSRDINHRLFESSYIIDDYSSMIEALSFALEWSKKLYLDEFDRINSLSDVLAFLIKSNCSIIVSEEKDWEKQKNSESFYCDEDMLYVISSYKGDFSEMYLDEESYDHIKQVMKSHGIDTLSYRSYDSYSNITKERIEKKRQKYDSIVSDPEMLKKALAECERRKKVNTAVLADLGLYY